MQLSQNSRGMFLEQPQLCAGQSTAVLAITVCKSVARAV